MADTGKGATVTFGTSGFTANKTRLNIGEQTREPLESTHLATTGNYKTFVPAEFVDPGELEIEYFHDPDAQAPITAAAETVTVTFPVPAAKNNGATLAGSAFCTGFTPGEVVNDELMRSSCTIKWAGNVTWTDAST